MIPLEILKKIRKIELRPNRIVTGFAPGARASARFTARTPAASKTDPVLNSIRPLKRRECRAPASSNSKPIEFDGFGNCGESAIIRIQAGEALPVLIPSSSTGLESPAAATVVLNKHDSNFKGFEFETFRNQAGIAGRRTAQSHCHSPDAGFDFLEFEVAAGRERKIISP